MNLKIFSVYIMANRRPTLYTGITNNLLKRVNEHKNKINPSCFTAQYNLNNLVYYENYDNPKSAIIREKQIKDLNRKEKLELIQQLNPLFQDLYPKVLSELNS